MSAPADHDEPGSDAPEAPGLPVFGDDNTYGYNGNRDDDRAYGSDDYDPDTGYQRDLDEADGGYNGYNGKDESRYDESDYFFVF